MSVNVVQHEEEEKQRHRADIIVEMSIAINLNSWYRSCITLWFEQYKQLYRYEIFTFWTTAVYENKKSTDR